MSDIWFDIQKDSASVGITDDNFYMIKSRGWLPDKWAYPLFKVQLDRGGTRTVEEYYALTKNADPTAGPNQEHNAAPTA